MQTECIRYLHAFLLSQQKHHQIAKHVERDYNSGFRQQLKQLWFTGYKRSAHADSSSFEHAFVGEIKPPKTAGDSPSVSGFHNWLMFLCEERRGRADYHGWIRPKHAVAHDPVVSVQLSWLGHLKPVSTLLVGASPECEVALYSALFFLGRDDAPVRTVLGSRPVAVVVHAFKGKIGSAYIDGR